MVFKKGTSFADVEKMYFVFPFVFMFLYALESASWAIFNPCVFVGAPFKAMRKGKDDFKDPTRCCLQQSLKRKKPNFHPLGGFATFVQSCLGTKKNHN